MYDPSREVAEEAIRSAGRLGVSDVLFVPPLLALMRNRMLKAAARSVLVGYGTDVLDTLAYVMRDPDEDIWVRRHIPSTLALIPSDRSVELLVEALGSQDGFMRFKAARALGRIRREHPELAVPAAPVEAQIQREANRYFSTLSLHYNLTHQDAAAGDSLLGRALQEKIARTVDRIYRLLALVYPPRDIAAARWTLEHGDSRGRAGALEYLDNLLTGAVRKKVLPVIEEVPLDEKVRKGNVLLKSRVRDAEESLAQLIHDDDQVVAATAIQFVESRALWALAGDLEYVLEHRDPRDWYVFEAASWALAARRIDEQARRARWMEPLPAVVLVDRLRRLPLFDFVSIDEMFRIAGSGRQVRHEGGRTLYERGTRAGTLEFLLDGTVVVQGAGEPPREIESPAALGFDELIQGAPAAETTRAKDRAICLALGEEDLLGLLSESVDLVQGLFRTLLERVGPAWSTGVHLSRHKADGVRLADGVQAIEKVLVLEEMPVLSRASATDLAALAGVAHEVRLTAGEVLFAESEVPAIFILLAGELSLEPMTGGEPKAAGPGDTVGVYATLSGADTNGWRAHVTAAGTALRIAREPLFDLLGDRIELVRNLSSAILHASGPAAEAAESAVH
jgi:HEAT repeat protein/CRP-like cAMP-binding protein